MWAVNPPRTPVSCLSHHWQYPLGGPDSGSCNRCPYFPFVLSQSWGEVASGGGVSILLPQTPSAGFVGLF